MTQYHTIPLRTQVAATLRKAILAGEYSSGQELSLTDIAQTLGVSRTPVREAFQLLEGEGLLTLRMNKGAVVCAIDRKFITDHYEMRMLLEGEAAFRAAQNGMDPSGLLEECRQLRSRLLSGNSQGYTDLNQRIHTAIWQAAGNEKLSNTLMNLWNGPSIGRTTNTVDHQFLSTVEHIDTLEYIGHRDAPMARRIMERHIQRSMENILREHREDAEAPAPHREDSRTPVSQSSVLAYIHSHIREQSLCTQAVSDHFGISISRVSREVKRRTGLGFLEYVHSQRIALAKEALLQESASVKQIALDVGYANALAFSRAFRRLEGMTPGAYRGRAR